MRQRLIRNVGGRIYLIPPEAKLFGAPSAAPAPTVTIKQSAGMDLPTPVVAAAAVLDAYASTINAVAAAGDRKIVVASSVGLARWTRYIIQCADGEVIQVRVTNFDGAGNVFLAGSLGRALGIGDTIKGCEIGYVVTAANAVSPAAGYQPWPLLNDYAEATAGPKPINLQLFRATWSYRINGVDYVSDSIFEINARLLKSTLQPDEVSPYLPDEWSHLLRLDDTSQFEVTFEDAWLAVLDDLCKAGYKPDLVMDAERLRIPHLLKTLELMSSTWGKAWTDWSKLKSVAYDTARDAALSDGDWYDSTNDALQQENEVKYTSVRFTR